VQWDDSSHAGFTQGIPWLPVNPNYVYLNAAAAVADPDSTFHHFRRLIALRRELPVLVEGRFQLLLPEHEQIWAVTRTLGDQVLLMVANCSSQPATVPAGAVPDIAGARELLSTHTTPVSAQLAPWESRIHLIG
jgi:oligo-1,6-glucosidase